MGVERVSSWLMLLKACNGVYSRWPTCLGWSGHEWRHTAPLGPHTQWRTLLQGLRTLYTTERNKCILNCMLLSSLWAIMNLLWKHFPHQQEWCSGRLQKNLRLVSKLQHCHLITAVHRHTPAQKAERVKDTQQLKNIHILQLSSFKTLLFFQVVKMFWKLKQHI